MATQKDPTVEEPAEEELETQPGPDALPGRKRGRPKGNASGSDTTKTRPTKALLVKNVISKRILVHPKIVQQVLNELEKGCVERVKRKGGFRIRFLTLKLREAREASVKPLIAPVQVCIYKYTEEAGDCWKTFKGDNVPLWQVQIDHNAQRSITFRLRDAFEDFLRGANASDSAMPTTVAELEKAAGIRLVIADQTNTEDVRFVEWRSVFYVAGDLNNFLLLLDGFFVWTEKSIAHSQPFQVEIHPYLDSHEAGQVWADLEYKEYSYNEPTKDLPLKIFEAPPPYGKRIVTLHCKLEGTKKLSLVFAGRIYEYRDRFQTKGIPGGFSKGDGDGKEKGKYCRLMKSLDVSEDAIVDKVLVLVKLLLLRLTD